MKPPLLGGFFILHHYIQILCDKLGKGDKIDEHENSFSFTILSSYLCL